jgi:iron complex outermembrane receptor protein
MLKRTVLAKSLLIAFSGTAALSGGTAFAQQAPVQELQRVEITGTSVRRIDAESALPVLVLRREDIQRSGATSTVDLLKKVSAVQGSTGESASVGGSTFGFSGVSIHNVGETRTLVLLNGHRLSLFGGQTLTGFAAGFDLNAIPISAIERVEVLTDGASALYGADAIAGVVNFITKRDISEGDVTIGFSNPKDGAKEKHISATKGFGSLAEDGYNVMLSFGHDERTQLLSTSRDFAKSGKVLFSQNGKNYRFQQFSASPIPANATDDAGNLISPYQKVNGVCPPKTFRVIDGTDDYCGFDFVGELEIYPERKRDSFVGSFTKKLGDHELFADLLLSRTSQVSRIAPVPGSISIPAGTALHDKYLLPIGITEDSLAFYRLYDLGKRTNSDEANFYDIALGSKGLFMGWDYNATYTRSQSRVTGDIAGYPGALAVKRLRKSGLLDPFVGPGQQSAAAQTAIDGTNYKGNWDGGVSQLDTLQVRGSRELATLPAGGLMLGTGVNFNKEKFESKPSLFAQGKLADPVLGTLCDPADPTKKCDQRFGDSSVTIPYSADRKSYGAFAELIIPATKQLEFGAAVRYDHFSDFGSATTAKGSFRWTPTPTLLVRGSIGSGFHAPTVPQVNAATQPYGVTSDKYACSADMLTVAAAQGAECRPGKQQYDQKAGGNHELQPEKSLQGTLGIRLEPASWLSLGADIWHVAIRDSFGQLPEQTVFANPLQYSKSWSSNLDVGTGKNYLAFLADNQNLGKSYATGIDFDISGRAKTSIGNLNSQLTLTYMLREDQQLLKDGPYYTAIGQNSPDLGVVTFRWQGRWATSLISGNWTNSLGVNFKAGYHDATQTVDVLDGTGAVTGSEDISLKIKPYYTFDWQTQWNFRKDMSLTAGLLNVFDKAPPFSLATSGTNKGQQFGYDDRYYDPRGRTLYMNFAYKF